MGYRLSTLLLCASLFLALPACSGGQSANGGIASSSNISGPEIERWLIGFSPDEWHVANNADDGTRMIMELVPPGETLEDWSRLLTLQIFRGTPVSSALFYERIGAGFEQACETARLLMLPDVQRGEYTVNIALVECGLNPATGLGEVVHFWVVDGRDALYVAQYAVRTETFDARTDRGVENDQLQEMFETFAGATVCIEGGPEPTCPAGLSTAD